MPRFTRLPHISDREHERQAEARELFGVPRDIRQQCSVPGCRTLTLSSLCARHRADPDAPVPTDGQ
jgi:hypothetical protein